MVSAREMMRLQQERDIAVDQRQELFRSVQRTCHATPVRVHLLISKPDLGLRCKERDVCLTVELSCVSVAMLSPRMPICDRCMYAPATVEALCSHYQHELSQCIQQYSLCLVLNASQEA